MGFKGDVRKSMGSISNRSKYYQYLALGLALSLSLSYSLYYFYKAQTPFFALSADDMHRALFAFEASQGNLIPSPFWPPLHFWIGGLVLRLYPNLLRMPMAVNLTFSLLGLAFLCYLARDLVGSQLVGLVAILITTFLPWHLWFSLSGLVEPIFHFFVILGFFAYLHWMKTGSKSHLLIAALSFLLSGMLRYEGWLFSLPFTLLLLVRQGLTLRRHGSIDPFITLCALIPWVFPAFWTAFLYLRYGDPIFYATVTRDYYLQRHGPDSLMVRIARYPRHLVQVSPLVFTLAWYGVFKAWKEQRRIIKVFFLLWLSEFAVVVLSSVNNVSTMHSPIRLVVINALLLIPFGATTLYFIWRRALWGKVLAVGLLLVICLAGMRGSSRRPQGLADDVAQIGSYVNELWKEGELAETDQVMIEVLYWDYLTLQFMTGHPDHVLFDRRPEAKLVNGSLVMDDQSNPSVLKSDADHLSSHLASTNVKVVIAYSEAATKQLEQVATEVYQGGRFTVFFLP
jgi:hypothetical protein